MWSQSTTPSASTDLHFPHSAPVSLVPPLYLLFPLLESSFHRHPYAPPPFFLQVSAQCLFIREASPNHPVRSITFHFLSPYPALVFSTISPPPPTITYACMRVRTIYFFVIISPDYNTYSLKAAFCLFCSQLYH